MTEQQRQQARERMRRYRARLREPLARPSGMPETEADAIALGAQLGAEPRKSAAVWRHLRDSGWRLDGEPVRRFAEALRRWTRN